MPCKLQCARPVTRCKALPKRVIVTRPAGQAHGWTQALRQAGFDALSLPLIAINPPSSSAEMQAAWSELSSFDAVMFVSANAVNYFFQAKPQGLVAFTHGASLKARAFATGPGTVAALKACGVEPDWIDAPDAQAGQFDSEALWDVVQSRVTPGCRVLIARGTVGTEHADSKEQADGQAALPQGAGRDWFASQVEQAGGKVEFVVTYERTAPQLGLNAIALTQVAAHDGSVWLFSSSEAVANLRDICPGQDWGRGIAIATHSRIAAAAREAGFGTVLESRPSLEALVASIESLP